MGEGSGVAAAGTALGAMERAVASVYFDRSSRTSAWYDEPRMILSNCPAIVSDEAHARHGDGNRARDWKSAVHLVLWLENARGPQPGTTV